MLKFELLNVQMNDPTAWVHKCFCGKSGHVQQIYHLTVHVDIWWRPCYVKKKHCWKWVIFLYLGNIGTELSSANTGMFITSDAGNSWRQVRPIWIYTMHTFTFNRLCTVSALPWLRQTCVFQCSLIQIFDNEHNVWFLDNGGALLAVLYAATPIRHLW